VSEESSEPEPSHRYTDSDRKWLDLKVPTRADITRNAVLVLVVVIVAGIVLQLAFGRSIDLVRSVLIAIAAAAVYVLLQVRIMTGVPKKQQQIRARVAAETADGGRQAAESVSSSDDLGEPELPTSDPHV